MEVYDYGKGMRNCEKAFLSFLALLIVVTAVIASFSPTASAATAKKVEVMYFWGDGCAHCKKLKPWLDEYEKENADKVEIGHYEIWKDKENAKLFKDVLTAHAYPLKEAGTPAVVVNGKVFVGTKEVEENLPKEAEDAWEKLQKDENPPSTEGKEKRSDPELSDYGAIALAALADSINPCAMMVLIILMSSLIVGKKTKREVIFTSSMFIFGVFVTYMLIGFGLTRLLSLTGMTDTVNMVIAFIIALIGVLELKDAFFYRKLGWAVEIPEAWRGRLSRMILSVTNPFGAFIIGGAVTFFELPCTGGPYLFGLSVISQMPSTWLMVTTLAAYNIIFVSPLILIAVLVMIGKTKIENAEEFRNRNVRGMHFIIGILMLIMSGWLIFMR